MRKLLTILGLLAILGTSAYAQTQGVQKEDTPARSGDSGVAVLFKRCDVATSSSGTDGDYTIPCVDEKGQIRVKVDGGSLSLDLVADAEEGLDPTNPPIVTAGIDANGKVAIFRLNAAKDLYTNVRGSSTCRFVSAASNNSTSCKSSAGIVKGIWYTNTTSTTYYLRRYNLASAPTCSSSSGVIGAPIPMMPTSEGGAMISFGQAFSAGIGFCITGGSADTDDTNAAVGIFGDIYYE